MCIVPLNKWNFLSFKVYEIALKDPSEEMEEVEGKPAVEIEMCDVDEDGNIIRLETVKSGLYYAL